MPAYGCDHEGVCRPLDECPQWAVQAFVADRKDEDWRASHDGGLADGMSARDFDPKALAEGLCVELEHTSCWWKALRIAMDHLVEHPGYYRALDHMESSLEGKEAPGGGFYHVAKSDATVREEAQAAFERRRQKTMDELGITRRKGESEASLIERIVDAEMQAAAKKRKNAETRRIKRRVLDW